MRRLALILALATGCAPSFQRGLDVGEQAAKALDVGLDESAKIWEAAVQAAIKDCRSRGLETPEQRRECLGIFAEGEKVIPVLEKGSEAYDMLVEALRLLRETEAALRPYLEQAKAKRP